MRSSLWNGKVHDRLSFPGLALRLARPVVKPSLTSVTRCGARHLSGAAGWPVTRCPRPMARIRNRLDTVPDCDYLMTNDDLAPCSDITELSRSKLIPPYAAGRPCRASRTPWRRCALASRPALAYIATGLSWSMNWSGSTIARTFSPRSSAPCSASVCSTCAAKPPIEPSSTVINTSCSRASRSTQLDVERLGEARIRHRRGQAVSGERLGRLQAFGEPRAEREQRD